MKKLTLLFILLLLFLGIPTIAHGASSSLVIRPNGNAGTNQWTKVCTGCTYNYETVDEETADTLDYVYIGKMSFTDEWTMQDVSGTILAGAVIDSVVLTERGKCTNTAGRKASLKIGSDYTSGTQRTNTAWTTYNEKLAAPGGRTYTRDNLDSLVVSVTKSAGLSASVYTYTCQAYVTVYYTPAVSGFDTTSVSNTSVNLICNKSTNTDYTRYQVRYSAGSTPPDSVTAGTYGDSSTADNDTVFAISSLCVNTQYSFTVFAKDGVPNWTKKGSTSYKTVTTTNVSSPLINSARTGADRAGVGTITWSSTGNIASSDNVYATAAVGTSHYLQASNFGFCIGLDQQIDGIKVEIEKSTTCFTGDTKILTPSGYKLIKDLKEKDLVYAFDEKYKLKPAKILKTNQHIVSDYLEIKTENQSVEVTAEHPFFTPKGLVKAGDLKIGDEVFLLKGIIEKIISKKPIKQEIKVYDLTVAGYHNYFANNFAVHNKTPDCRDYRVSIVKADNSIGSDNKFDEDMQWPTSDAYSTYGGATDLWWETWTPDSINDADFGVVISADVGTANAARVDHIRITVYCSPLVVSGVDTTSVNAASVNLKCNKLIDTNYKRYKVMYLAGSTAPDSQNQSGAIYGDASTEDNDTLFVVSGLSGSTQYSFSVFAKNADSTIWTKKGSASWVTVTTDQETSPPDTVTSVDTTSAGPGATTVPLKWHPVDSTDCAGYEVRYKIGVTPPDSVTQGFLGGSTSSRTDTSLTVSQLCAGTQYSFSVFAKDEVPNWTVKGSTSYKTVTTDTSSAACTVYVAADAAPQDWDKDPADSTCHYCLVDDPAGNHDYNVTRIYTTTDAEFDWFVPDTFQINCIPDSRIIDSVVVKKVTYCYNLGLGGDGASYTYLKDGSDSVSSGKDQADCALSTWTDFSWSSATHPGGSAWTKTNLKSTILGLKSSISGYLPHIRCTQFYYIVYHSVVSLSISIDTTTWDLDTLNPSQIKTMVTGEKIKVKNDGNVSEQLSLKITDMDTKDEWACTSSANGQGVNKYVMSGVFRHKDSTTSGSFNATGNEDVIDTLTQWASSDTFAVGTQAVGANVIVNDSLYLWLQMKMPTTASGPKADSTRNIIIQIGCQQAP